MSENHLTSISPDLVLHRNDPGDEVQKRFRYQTTYSCILAIMMAEETSAIQEIFCELHEDILVKYADGKFNGIQVKTKDINFPPFTIEDEAIIKSCIKFTKLELAFPGQFKQFTIVSNHGFDITRPAVCLNSFISGLNNGSIDLTKRNKFTAFINTICKECNCLKEKVVEALKKLKVTSFCALEDAHFKLTNQIKLATSLAGIQGSKVEEIADLLLARQYKASSLHLSEEKLPVYILGDALPQDEIRVIINAKRITKAEITEWLTSQKTSPVELLLKDRYKIAAIPQDHKRLDIKMDAGGIDSDNIDLIRNFKFAFENHAASWIYKNGSEKAEAQYNQVSFITQNICKEVFDKNKIGETDDGLQMLIGVRDQLKERHSKNNSPFFDCTYEHLLGAVGVLTENCKVWWSKKFELPND